jgi:hypothetical protein
VNDTTTFRRNALAACLVLTPLLMLVSTALQPPFVTSYVDRLADLDEHGAAAWVSNVAFILTQAPMLVALLGIAGLLQRRSPRLACSVMVLGVLATFGEAVMGGTGLVYLTMSGDTGNREVLAGVWEQVESSPVMLFGLVGFGGTVVTLLLVAIALFRTAVAPRWVPAAVVAFLVLELVGSGLTDYASYAAGTCLLVGFGALARLVSQSPQKSSSNDTAPLTPTW